MGHLRSGARPAALLLRAPGDLPRDRPGADGGVGADRLRAPAPLQSRDLRGADPEHPGGARRGALGPGLGAGDQLPAVLLPGLGARQGAADPRALGAGGGPLAPARRARDDRPGDAGGAGARDVRDRPARPRLGPRLRDDRADAAVRGGRPVAPPGGAAGAGRDVDRARAGGRPGGGGAGAARLPGRTPDGLPAPLRQPAGKSPLPGELSAARVDDRDRRGPEDRQRGGQHPDQGELRARGQHRLHLRGGRRALRLRGRGARSLAVRAVDLAHPADPDVGQGSVRCAGGGGGSGYAYVSGVRQRGRGRRHHARHRRHAAAHELRRFVGDRDAAGHGPAAVGLRAGARHRGFEGPCIAALAEQDRQCSPRTLDHKPSRLPHRETFSGARSKPIPKDRSTLKKQVLVSVDRAETRVALMEATGAPVAAGTSSGGRRRRGSAPPGAGYRIAELYLERRGARSIVGNIYKGKVDNVLPGLEAAFVDIGLEKNGFLHVDEIVLPGVEAPRRGRGGGRKISELLKPGQEVVVQVIKDPLKTKGARLSMELAIAGRYMVYQPTGEGVGVSRRLEDRERERLRKQTTKLDLGGGGAIVRTAAHGAKREDFERELLYLHKLHEVLVKRVQETAAPEMVFQEADLSVRVVRDIFSEHFERAIVDDEQQYRRLVSFFTRTAPELVERVELWQGRSGRCSRSTGWSGRSKG